MVTSSWPSLAWVFFHWAFQPPNSQPMDIHHQATIAQMPINIREALSQFNIKSNTVVYAVCPNCHFTYSPQFALGDRTPKYTSHCMHQPTLESDVCGQPLLRRSQSDLHKPQPIKPFVYYSFHDYLATLLSRKDLEGLMDKACNDLHSTSSKPLPEFTLDIWDVEFLKALKTMGYLWPGETKGDISLPSTMIHSMLRVCGFMALPHPAVYYPWFALIFPQISTTSPRICMLLVLSPVCIRPKKCSSIIIFNLSSMTWKFHGTEE